MTNPHDYLTTSPYVFQTTLPSTDDMRIGIAAMCLQSILARQGWTHATVPANEAVRYADALLAALARDKEDK